MFLVFDGNEDRKKSLLMLISMRILDKSYFVSFNSSVMHFLLVLRQIVNNDMNKNLQNKSKKLEHRQRFIWGCRANFLVRQPLG